MLCGAEGFTDMALFGRCKADWFQTWLALPNGIPSHDTFNRVFAARKPEAFLDRFLRWTQGLRQTVAHEIVALDGKALRRALNRVRSPRYIVSALAQGNGLVLGQLKVADQRNEIIALPQLLRVLELAGCLVTIDALGCQKTIAKEIIEADADYVLALKGNQGRSLPRCRATWTTPSSNRDRCRPIRPRLSQSLHWPTPRRWARSTAGWKSGAIGKATG